VSGHVDVLVCWSVVVLVWLGVGVLCVGVLVLMCWCVGVLVCWSVVVLVWLGVNTPAQT
jgi:hypothetical protein